MSIQLSGSLVITGSITTTGVITMSGSIASASYSSTSDLLQGTGSVGFTTTASFNAVSSSQQQISASLLNVIAIGATTGSNSFRADQSITGSLVVSSTITAQTLVVQTVTSSIVYSSGSNNFGNQLANTQTFTGSVNITGSLALAGNITGNAITLTGALGGTSATFSGNGLFGGSTNAGNAGTYTLSVGLAGTTAGGIQLWAATNQTHFIQFGDGTASADNYRGYIAYAHGTDSLILGTASTDRLIIDSSGRTSIGYTTNPSTYMLDVNGTGRFSGTITTNGEYRVDPASGDGILRIYTAGTERAAVRANATKFYIEVGTFGERLSINNSSGLLTYTGAATFSANSTTLNVNTSTRVLEVTGKNSYYATQIIGGTGTGTSYGLSVNAGTNSSDIAFQVYNQTETAIRLFVRGDGNVGIGTSSPDRLFHINADTSTTTAIQKVQNAGTGDAVTEYRVTGTSWYAGIDNSDGDSFKIGQDPLGTTDRFVIKDGGNVGIGNTGSATDRLSVSDGSTYTFNIGAASGGAGAVLATFGSAALTFATNGTANERMRITSGGEVLVNSTSTGLGFANASKFGSYQPYTTDSNTTTLSTQRTAGMFAVSGGDNSNNQGSYVALAANVQWGASSNPGALFRGYQNTTLSIQINYDGNITNTNNSYGAISDISLKENIVDATPKLNDLLAVRIRNYNLKGDATKQLGVVAQELEEVFPSMVETGSDSIKSVKYSIFVPILVKAIQELSAKVTALETK